MESAINASPKHYSEKTKMKKNTMWLRWIMSIVCVLGFQTIALAEEHGSRDEAKAMVDAAVEHVKKVGPDQAFKDFSDKSNKTWQKKDLYVFAYNMDGVNMAHGANEGLVGKNLVDLKDSNGKPLVRELRETAAKGSGWVEYDWPHPQSKKVESKASYVRKLDNYNGFVGVGVYR
ncbi:MAG TPA: cache domain-containing protein [Burkholderiaceae bacterium]|nr:cache domain-containing protein [Burkholderiaceae bacterium]